MVFILMNIWILEKIQWNITTWRKDFCCHLNTAVITDADHAHPKLVCKVFEIKYLGEYHDLYVQSATYLRTLEIFTLKHTNLLLGNIFISRLAKQAALKRIK